MRKFKIHVFASAMAVALLAACGGGGSGGGMDSPVAPQSITLTGTAATGAAMAGATINVVDTNGLKDTCDSPSDSSGNFSCLLKNAKTAPFLLQASVGSLSMHAVLADANATRVNITPISEMAAQKFASAANLLPSEIIANKDDMAKIANRSTAAAEAVTVVNAVVNEVAKKVGLSGLDLIRGELKPGDVSNNLDRLLSTVKLESVGSGFTVSVAATNGDIVSVNVEHSQTQAGAVSATQSAINNLGSVDLDAGQTVEAAIRDLIDVINKGSAEELAAMAAYKFDEGRTPRQWAEYLVKNERPYLGELTVKSIERLGIEPITGIWFSRVIVKSGKGGTVEFFVGMKKVGSAWKLAGNELPMKLGLQLRHTLALQNGFPESKGYEDFRFFFTRLINVWVGNEGMAENATLPAWLSIAVLPMNDLPQTDVIPDIVLKRSPECHSAYTLADSDDCLTDQLLMDEEGPLFKKMAAGMTKYVVKALDANGNCLNCKEGGRSKSVMPAQRAFAFTRIFGADIAPAKLTAGLPAIDPLVSKLESSAMRYFATPSQADAMALIRTFVKGEAGAVTVKWRRPTLKPDMQIDGIWGGIAGCGDDDYSSFPQVPALWAGNASSHTWEVGTDLKKAVYGSVAINAVVLDTVFNSQINVNRPYEKICGSPLTAAKLTQASVR